MGMVHAGGQKKSAHRLLVLGSRGNHVRENRERTRLFKQARLEHNGKDCRGYHE